MKNIPLTENEIKEIKNHYSEELEKLQKRANEIRGILDKIETNKIPVPAKIDKTAEKPGKKNVVAPKVKKAAVTSLVSNNSKPAETAASKKTAVKESKSKAPVAKATESVKKSKTDKKVVEKAKKVAPKAKTAKAPKKAVITKTSSKVNKKALKSATAEVKKAKVVKTAPKTKEPKGRKKSADSIKAQYETYILNMLSKQGKMLTSKAIFDAVEKDYKVAAPNYSKMKANVTVILSKEKAGGKLIDIIQKGTKAKLYGLKEWFDDKGNIKDSSRMI